MKRTKKTSGTSIRVLETLKFLYQNNASIQDIINHFEKIDPNNRIYTNEVIAKYINTLKVFELRFRKDKDKYVLLNTPIQFDFNENELQAIKLIEKFADILPEEVINKEITEFLQDLEKRFSDDTRRLASNIKRMNFTNPNINYQKYAKQIKTYEKYCFDRQKLKITYRNILNKEVTSMVEPNEIKYIGNNVYLSIYNPLSAQIQDINFTDIIEVSQLPLKSNSNNMYSSVIFELKGRLAKSYKLHESEKLLKIEDNGNILIINQKEDCTLLLKRLMRYGENCEIISPKSLREEMIKMLNSILAKYN